MRVKEASSEPKVLEAEALCIANLSVDIPRLMAQILNFVTSCTQMNNILSQTPDLSVSIQNERAQTWQLNTYVDQDTRICRGDGGSDKWSECSVDMPSKAETVLGKRARSGS